MVHNKTVTLRRTLNFRKLVTTLPEMALWKKPSLREHSNSLLITSPFSTPKLHHRSLNICHEFASFLSLPFESCPNSIRWISSFFFSKLSFFYHFIAPNGTKIEGKILFLLFIDLKFANMTSFKFTKIYDGRRLTPRHFPSSILKIALYPSIIFPRDCPAGFAPQFSRRDILTSV